MYRFLWRPRWIAFHLLIIAVVALMVNLAFWQLNRLDQRKEFNEQVRANREKEVVPASELLTDDADLKALEWRPVEMTGTYIEGSDLILVNVSQFGGAGVDAMSVMETNDGTRILVNRGFIPLIDEIPPAPKGEVKVFGYLRRSEEHRTGSTDNPSEGTLTEIQRIDIPRIDEQVEGDLAPMYVQLVSNSDVAPYPVALPELSNGPHLSYAIQWAIFSICAIIGWVLVIRRTAKKNAESTTEALVG